MSWLLSDNISLGEMEKGKGWNLELKGLIPETCPRNGFGKDVCKVKAVLRQCVCVCVCECECVCMHSCIHACMCACVCVYMCL